MAGDNPLAARDYLALQDAATSILKHEVAWINSGSLSYSIMKCTRLVIKYKSPTNLYFCESIFDI